MLLILLLLVFHQISFSVSSPLHRVHARWAVDLELPASGPTTVETVLELTFNDYLLWLVFTIITVILLLCCFVCYPFRAMIWRLIRNRFSHDPVRSNNTVRMSELGSPTGLESDNVVGTEPLVLEGRQNTQAVQVTWDNINTLVYILAMLAVQERDIGVTVSVVLATE